MATMDTDPISSLISGDTLDTLDSAAPVARCVPATLIAREVARRRTFGIISHPDAGKTTLTEKLLLFSGAIQLAGTVKARKSGRHATSDWMEIEKQRGISVASSVMQFEYRDHVVNLLDTPGHQDFSEDTYYALAQMLELSTCLFYLFQFLLVRVFLLFQKELLDRNCRGEVRIFCFQ